jgi:uncharacterized protein YndB with AHSA1/START domain
MTRIVPNVVERVIRLPTSPAEAYAYFTEPELLNRWFGSPATAEPRPGGRLRAEVEAGYVVVGEYLELDPPHRVVFTFGGERDDDIPPGSTVVEIDITPDGEGSIVRLTHRGLPPSAVSSVEAGWGRVLPRLLAQFGSDAAQ